MTKRNLILSKRPKVLLFLLSSLLFFTACSKEHEVDVCVYGGTSAGVIAAYTAKKMGKSVLLIEPGSHLGGMSSGGLGMTDIGNKYVVTGLALDFYRQLGSHYGELEQWIFEPSVAEAIFQDYVNSAEVEVWYQRRLYDVRKEENVLTEIILEQSNHPQRKTDRRVKAKMFIDCSYEGDLMAKANVSYTVGREDNSLYGETYNGVQIIRNHQFEVDVDPYVIPGDSTSGLLWGISPTPMAPFGSGDHKVQAYNFRITLTSNPENRIPITKPPNYDPAKYELLIRLKEKEPWKSLEDIFIWSHMPNSKTDINNRGAFSTDMIGANWTYPDADYEERTRIWQEHVDYTKGLLYFVGHDERIPPFIREEMQQWGYPQDEYVDNDHWSYQLYVREARRLIGEEVMTQHHCEGRVVVNDPIAWAAYTMDSHNCDRQIVDGVVKNEGNVEIGGFDPFPISYKAITPKQEEAKNLLVPVCLSASHIAFGSIRMEPVFMVLAQSAAIASILAIDEYDQTVQRVEVAKIQEALKRNPFSDKRPGDILIDNDDESSVFVTGKWETWGHIGYGPTYLMDRSKGAELKSVKYTINSLKEGVYDLYFYYPRVHGASAELTFTVFNGKEGVEKKINTAEIVIKGQTAGCWVSLGDYFFSEGSDAYVELSNKGADGFVVADALLLVPTF